MSGVGLAARLLVNVLILTAIGLHAVGVFAPLLTVEKFYFFSNQVTLYSGTLDLWRAGEWGLFFIVAGFSIVLPLGKNLFLLLVWNIGAGRRRRRLLGWLAHYGKWSMLDVFVVALLLVTVKLDAIANVTVHYGVYVFAGSVLLTLALSQLMAVIDARTD